MSIQPTTPATRLCGVAGVFSALLAVAVPVWLLVLIATKAEATGFHGSPLLAFGVLVAAGIPAILLTFGAHKLLQKYTQNRFEDLSWLKAPLAVFIGAVSMWMLYLTAERAYWEYYVLPKAGAADGYSYPQLRYTMFSAVVVLWCIDGLAASFLLVQRAFQGKQLSTWSYRTTVAFFALFGILVIGGAFGMCIRSMGL